MTDSRPERQSTPNLTDRAVPGRIAVGTVTRVGLVRQEPLVTRKNALLIWATAIPCVLAVALAPVIGGPSLLVKALLVASAGGLCVFAVLRWGPRTREVDVLPFWIKEVSGSEHECLARGRLPKGPPDRGDHLEVHGKRAPGGSISVRRLVSTGGEVSRVRLPFGAAAALAASFLVGALWVSTAVFLAWLLAFHG